MQYRVIGEKNGSEVILAQTESPGIAIIIAEHLALTLREYPVIAVQECLRGREVWRTVRVVSKEATKRTVQINNTLVRYTPA